MERRKQKDAANDEDGLAWCRISLSCPTHPPIAIFTSCTLEFTAVPNKRILPYLSHIHQIRIQCTENKNNVDNDPLRNDHTRVMMPYSSDHTQIHTRKKKKKNLEKFDVPTKGKLPCFQALVSFCERAHSHATFFFGCFVVLKCTYKCYY